MRTDTASVLDVDANDILSYLRYNRDEDNWNDKTISSCITQFGFSYINSKESAIPKTQLILYYAIYILENYSEPTENGSQLRFKKSELNIGDDFLQEVVNFITNTRAKIISLNQQLSPDVSEDVDMIQKLLGEFTKEFWGVDATKNRRHIKTYNEANKVKMYIDLWRDKLELLDVKKELLLKGSTNNCKGYNAPTVTQVKRIIKQELEININIDSKNRKSRIISRMIELILD